MRISDILRTDGRAVSFEFFPPKDDAGFVSLFETIEALKALDPSYVSVTYGAGGSTRRKTVELVKRIKHEIGIESMAHLTCVGANRDEIGGVLDDLAAAGLENVLPLRGDPPKGESDFVPTPGGFRYANELVAFIRERHSFCLGGACYPEKHPEAPSAEADLDNLKRKVDAGVDFLITQLFFDNDDYLRFRERAVAAGVRVPILAGIMPILNVKQIKRFTRMCGASLPNALRQKIEAVEDDAEAVRQVGIYHATRQCEDLLRDGAPGIHFYTLNRSTATRAIYQSIKGLLANKPAA
ncbi:MAG: methylenetetrahydrofolate reductase [NAD(P)H] [Bryobacterales bacterium]|nr:methylenetetrahydrofolate reductase [NAD(P)H] [Bryobacterales bacterium]MDE0296563.1 methylenetetrahydrofolate reductase [NAD(P)H] [Bryobacterales bacterium]